MFVFIVSHQRYAILFIRSPNFTFQIYFISSSFVFHIEHRKAHNRDSLPWTQSCWLPLSVSEIEWEWADPTHNVNGSVHWTKTAYKLIVIELITKPKCCVAAHKLSLCSHSECVAKALYNTQSISRGKNETLTHSTTHYIHSIALDRVLTQKTHLHIHIRLPQ